MLLQLREDDQGGGPLKGPLGAPHLKGLVGGASSPFKGLLRVQDQGLGCPGFGHNGSTCKSPLSTVLSVPLEGEQDNSGLRGGKP